MRENLIDYTVMYTEINLQIKKSAGVFPQCLKSMCYRVTLKVIMADSGEVGDAGVMKITVKTPKEKHTVEVKVGASVKEVCSSWHLRIFNYWTVLLGFS